jgi:AcrR family transcriptional regulator
MWTMAAEHKGLTRRRLELALRRLQVKAKAIPGGKISIAGVAREAGVSNATIHNRYPDIADRIRSLQAKVGSRVAKTLPDNSDTLQSKLVEANEEIRHLKTCLAKSQSINLRLSKENELLQARLQRQK